MNRVRVFLSTPLYTVRGQDHLPHDTLIVEGNVKEMVGGGMVLAASQYWGRDGASLPGKPCSLYLPASKIDHALLLESA